MLARYRIKRAFLKREEPHNVERIVHAQVPVAKLLRSFGRGRSVKKEQLASHAVINSAASVETPYGRIAQGIHIMLVW